MKKILYLAVHDTSYPRNCLIRLALEREGCAVAIVERDIHLGFVRGSAQLIRGVLSRPRRGTDVVVLSELALQYAVHARIIAWLLRAHLVVDAFVGMYETNVEDWGLVRTSSLRGRAYHRFDMLAARVGRFTLTDTDVRARAWQALGARRPLVVPVGAPSWAQPTRMPRGGPLRVLYYGNYIPLHGLDYVADALRLVSADTRVEWTFVGNGSERERLEAAIREAVPLGTPVSFVDPVPVDELARLIENAHVVLGVFGSSPKAASVIANKVWQGLAAGRYVVTRSSAALAEVFGLPSGQLIEVDPENPSELASVIDDLARRHAERSIQPFWQTREVVDQYVRGRLNSSVDAVVGRSVPVPGLSRERAS